MLELLTDKKAFTTELIALLEARAQQLSVSEAELSRRLGGSDALLKNLRKGSMPSADRLDAILSELGISLTLGAKKEPLPCVSTSTSPADFAAIPLHDAALAAGNGHENGGELVVAHLAFRRDWLQRVGVSPAQAVLARVEGDSMAPTIHPKDLVLIDRARRDVPTHKRSPKDTRPSPIFALLDDGKARVKRIERPEPGLVILQSDNPAYGPEFKTGADIDRLNIIGKVVWWGHTVRE